MAKLSIIVPYYNEQVTLADCVQRVVGTELPVEREVILVDDGSSDKGGEVAAQLQAELGAELIKTVRHERNCGKGRALRSGFAEATGDYVVVQDADLEYDPADLPRLLKPMLDGRADVVYGSRFLGGEEKRVLFYWHCVGNNLLTWLSNMCTNLNMTDMETGYKLFRREVLEGLRLKSDGFGIEPEITAKVAKGRWRIYEVGISYSGRTYAEGKKITAWDGLKALGTIIRFRLFD
ncbi:MAG: glycosyltransferase family 2 protein [Sedimentisphaerales bacterium]|nr:glycosyltransferase family 2 protein [Sedimentisphaerales bacterium]